MQTKAISVIRRFRAALERLETPAVVREVSASKLTYLDRSALCWLAEQVAAVEKEGVPGNMLETGCALGGSAIVIAASKASTRRLELYDVFGQIPPPSAKDGKDVLARYQAILSGQSAGIDGDTYYGYQPDLLGKVASHFRDFGLVPEAHNVHFVAGTYQDTLHPSGPVALAHIDCDWYESVMVCLERIRADGLLTPGESSSTTTSSIPAAVRPCGTDSGQNRRLQIHLWSPSVDNASGRGHGIGGHRLAAEWRAPGHRRLIATSGSNG